MWALFEPHLTSKSLWCEKKFPVGFFANKSIKHGPKCGVWSRKVMLALCCLKFDVEVWAKIYFFMKRLSKCLKEVNSL